MALVRALPLIFTFSLLFLTLLPFLSQANSPQPHNKKSPPSEFLKHLQGCHKGDNVKGIYQLKKYLQHFGYLNYSHNQSRANDDDFDDFLESAIKIYQQNFNLEVTGTVNSKTVSQMSKSRCGVPDIVSGTTRMRSGKRRPHQHHNHGSNFHTVSHFEFFDGNPKWPAFKYHLTYAFLTGTPSEAIKPVARAFETWAANTHFTFSRVEDEASADIKIGFARGNHGDGDVNAFDGRGMTLAHAFAPTDGRFHFDADEPWAVGAVSGAYDMETVALHEIGHLLGLQHSSVEGAIMAPTIAPGITKGLHGDDIAGIKALYN